MEKKDTGRMKASASKTLSDFIGLEEGSMGRIKAITTKKLSDFVQLEEGSTGKQSALKIGAVLGGSVLAQVLFSALESAHGDSVGSIHSSTTISGDHKSAL